MNDQYADMLDTCPCCGHRTVSSEYDICSICGWEDDYVQRRYPDTTGANHATTLRQAQRNYAVFGASTEQRADRLLGSEVERNPAWRPLPTAGDPGPTPTPCRLRWPLLTALVILALTCAGPPILLQILFNGFRPISFDAALWQAAPPGGGNATRSQDSVRLRMADDLLRRGLLNGKTQPEVQALLGPPDGTAGYFRDYDMAYRLGPERGLMSIDYEWLVIRLDETGRVSEASLVTD